MSPSKEGFHFERAAEIALPHGSIVNGVVVEKQAVVDALKALWKLGKFTTDIVRLGMGGDSVIARAAEMEWLPDADFSRLLPHLVADRLMIKKDEYSLDYHALSEYPVKENGEDEEDVRLVPKRYVLVTGGKTEAVNSIVEAARAAKLKPISIDLNSLALLRVHQGPESERNAVDVSIDIGAEVMTISLHKFGQPLYLRDVTGYAGNHLTSQIKEELDVSFPRAEYRKFETLYSEVPREEAEFTSFFESDSAREEASATHEGDAGDHARLERIERIKPILAQGSSDIIYVVRETLDDFFASAMGNDLTQISGFSMSGGVSNMPGLIERLGAEFRTNVYRSTPLTPLLTPKTQKNVKPEVLMLENTFAIAVGLATGTGASHA